jgi:uncharacterized protein YecE (DUF72 family)
MLYVGTSGWDYPEWRAEFYPRGVPRRAWLEHLSERLNACEINATFYRLQPPGTFERWVAATPPSFRFTVKVHRRLTHTRRVSERDRLAFLDEFVASLTPLRPRLAALLWQFPPTRERDTAMLERVLASLPDIAPSAFEFRHPSWSDPEVTDALLAAGAVRCLAETEGANAARLEPGEFGYVRLRADRYRAGARRSWLDLLCAEGRARDVYAFCKHREAAAGDPFTGVGLACWLHESALGSA